jgi:hypothetical protein
MAACILSGVIASGISALTGPSVGDNKPALTISVNRAGKSDRLELAPKGEQLKPNPAPAGCGEIPQERAARLRARCQPPCGSAFPYYQALLGMIHSRVTV